MPTAITMPKLGMTMREGTVLEWRAAPGERIERGQALLLIESEKAEVEIESPTSGVLRHVYEEPDATVPCGTLLAALADSADEPFDAEAFRAEQKAPAPAASGASGRAGAAPGRRPTARRREGAPVTPAARRRARELGLELAGVEGSGPGGRVTLEDVEALAERAAARVPAAGGVALEVPSVGEGDPVLLLPGFGTDVTAFARQGPALAERYRVRGVNPRGVGLSDAPEAEAYDVATAAADVAAIAQHPAHVVGASLGACVALELALTAPERVRSLALVTPFVRAGGRLLAVLDAWCALAEAGAPEALARALVPWMFSAAFLEDARRRERAVRSFAEIAARVPPATLRRSALGLERWSGSREPDLDGVRAPVLVIAAEEDLLTPDAAGLARQLPDARLVVVPGAGHAVALEAPDAVNEALLRHLAGV